MGRQTEEPYGEKVKREDVGSVSEQLGYLVSTYRKRYAEFLRIDFPRIPFVETKAQFDELSKLGDALGECPPAEQTKAGQAGGDLKGKGNHEVEAVRYSPAEQAVYINKSEHFAPVPEEVWNFHIGGYQVIDKYLKSRKGRTLSLDELNHIGAIADSLAFTIQQMAKIDEAYSRAFPAQVENPE